VSYADFITLLFAFFTTLYAISNVDLQKMNRLVSSLQVAFDAKGQPAPTGRGGSPGAGARTSGPAGAVAAAGLTVQGLEKLSPRALAEVGRGYLEATLGDVRKRLTQALEPAVTDGRVSIDVDPRGLVVSIRETGSFPTGSAELTDATRAIIGEVGASLRGIDNPVRVEGHTDDVPIHTARFASNWELSTARATVVVAFLIQTSSIPADRLSAAGYGEFHPMAPNTSEVNRARNRRVDIVILNQTTALAEEPARIDSK
jgi:chemotaxis protein MotB